GLRTVPEAPLRGGGRDRATPRSHCDLPQARRLCGRPGVHSRGLRVRERPRETERRLLERGGGREPVSGTLILIANHVRKFGRPVPVLHILDAVCDHANAAGVRRLGLTGTGFTMSDGFYQQELERRGLAVVLPVPEEQAEIHRIIYEELIIGNVAPASVAYFATIASNLAGRGAEAVLLACTELELGRYPYLP